MLSMQKLTCDINKDLIDSKEVLAVKEDKDQHLRVIEEDKDQYQIV